MSHYDLLFLTSISTSTSLMRYAHYSCFSSLSNSLYLLARWVKHQRHIRGWTSACYWLAFVLQVISSAETFASSYYPFSDILIGIICGKRCWISIWNSTSNRGQDASVQKRKLLPFLFEIQKLNYLLEAMRASKMSEKIISPNEDALAKIAKFVRENLSIF